MSHHALLEYIQKAKEYGASDQEIAARLSGSGWYRVDIQDALELHRRISLPATLTSAPIASSEPSLTKRLAPRSYDPHVVMVAAVSFAIGFVGYLLVK